MTAVQTPHRFLNASSAIHYVMNLSHYRLTLSHSAAISCLRGAQVSYLRPTRHRAFTLSHPLTPKSGYTGNHLPLLIPQINCGKTDLQAIINPSKSYELLSLLGLLLNPEE